MSYLEQPAFHLEFFSGRVRYVLSASKFQFGPGLLKMDATLAKRLISHTSHGFEDVWNFLGAVFKAPILAFERSFARLTGLLKPSVTDWSGASLETRPDRATFTCSSRSHIEALLSAHHAFVKPWQVALTLLACFFLPAEPLRSEFTSPPNDERAQAMVSPSPLSSEAKEAAAAGMAAFEKGDFEMAALRFRRMLALAPDHPMALVNLATAEFQLGHHDEAERLLERSLTLKPAAPEVWTTLGIVRLTAGDARGAMTALAMASYQAPDAARTRNYLGVALAELGWLMGAEAELRKAIELDPEYAEAHFNLALVYLRLSPPSIELAKRHYHRALELGSSPDPIIERKLNK